MSNTNNKNDTTDGIFEMIINLNSVKHLKDRNALLEIVYTIKSDKNLLDFFTIEILEKIVRASETWDEENDKIYKTPWTKEFVTEFNSEIYRVLLVKEDYKKIIELVAYMKSIGIEDEDYIYSKMLDIADIIKEKYHPDINTLS